MHYITRNAKFHLEA